MHAGIDFRMVADFLRHAKERIHLGQQLRERSALAQHGDHSRRRIGSIRPIASSRQTRSGASVASSPDADSLRSNASVSGATTKSKRAAKRATRSTRSGSSANAGETWRERARPQIRFAAERIDQRAILGARHRIDREVPSLEVLLERHLRRGEKLEAAIAMPVLALGAGQRVLLARLRVEKHGKIAADRTITRCDQHLGRRADHHPVTVTRGPPEELVADRAADTIDFHRLPTATAALHLRCRAQRPTCVRYAS